MRKHCLFSLLVILTIFSVVGCDNGLSQPQYGSLSVSANKGETKTIEPSSADLTITTYKVKGVHANKTEFAEEIMTSNPYTKTGLIVGQWTITVNGYNSNDKLIASKSETVTITKDSTSSKTFNLEYLKDGTGSYSITFAVPISATSLSKISYSITPISGGPAVKQGDVTTYTTADNKRKYTITESSISTGSYNLIAELKNSNDAILYKYGPEIVRIYKGLQSKSEIFIDEKYIPMAVKPVISPNGGNFIGKADVTITCATSGATIYYTLDGTTPTDSSTQYTGQFSLTKNTECIKAIAFKTGLTSSEVASSSPFYIAVEAPAISPNGGAYNNPQSVTISAVDGATIYYTLDGSTPTKSSTQYTASFNVAKNNTVVKAIATKENMENSSVTASQNFSFKVATPTISPESCTTETSLQVTLASTTTGASIRYTTDGTAPTSTSGTVYNAPITLSETEKTVKAIAYLTDMSDSDVATSQKYIITVKAPSIAIQDAGSGKKRVVLTGGTEGATITYTTDGGATWNPYTIGTTVLEFSTETTVRFKIEKTGLTSVEKTITVTWDNGSGKFDYTSPTHYSLSIKTPDDWTGLLPIQCKANISAEWIEAPKSVTYSWYLDGVIVDNLETKSIVLGKDIILEEGGHNITVYAVASDAYYSCNLSVCSYVKEYVIGDIGPAGGYVFYDKGEYSDNWRYMECAQEIFKDVKYVNSKMLHDGYSSINEIGGGKPNTLHFSTLEAAKKCLDYSINNFDDWYLPCLMEMSSLIPYMHANHPDKLVYCQKDRKNTKDAYWTSSVSKSSFGGNDYFSTSKFIYDPDTFIWGGVGGHSVAEAIAWPVRYF